MLQGAGWALWGWAAAFGSATVGMQLLSPARAAQLAACLILLAGLSGWASRRGRAGQAGEWELGAAFAFERFQDLMQRWIAEARGHGAAGLAVLVASGWAAGAATAAWRVWEQQRQLDGLQLPRLVWVAGHVARGWELRDGFATAWLTGARASPQSCPGPGQGKPLGGGVQLEAAASVARQRPLMAGGWVCARGLLQQPREASLSGEFSPRRYLRARGVVARLQVRSPARLHGPADQVPVPLKLRLAQLAHHGREALEQRVRSRAGETAHRWFRAIALGEQQALDGWEQLKLRVVGLSHLTSVSGMHVGLLAGPLWMSLARWPQRGVRVAVAAAAVIAGWLYALATGMESPAVRALLMQLATWCLKPEQHPASRLGVMGWTAWLQLAHNPYLAQDPGFQLSYLATAALVVASLTRPQGLPRVARELWASVAAWALSAPVVAWLAAGSSPWGVLASALSAPPAALLLWSGLFAAVLPEGLAAPAGLLARLSAHWLDKLVDGLFEAAWRWPLWLSGSAGLAVAAGWMGWQLRRLGRDLAASAAMLGAMGMLAFSVGQAQGPPRPWVGMPLGGGGWMWAGSAGQAAWAVLASGSRPQPARMGQRAGVAMAAAGLGRLDLVIWLQTRSPLPHHVQALGPPAARAAVAWCGPSGWRMLTSRGRLWEGSVRTLGVSTVRFRCHVRQGVPVLEVWRTPGAVPLGSIDVRGCLAGPNGVGYHCAARQGVRFQPEAWAAGSL